MVLPIRHVEMSPHKRCSSSLPPGPSALRRAPMTAYRSARGARCPETIAFCPFRAVTPITAIVRERDRPRFHTWLAASETSTLAEVRGFAAGIRRDQAAEEAALTTPWSNGQIEGQINRLKTLKRQMYGRAKLDLLRKRFLAAA